jgi:hypothetical protein
MPANWPEGRVELVDLVVPDPDDWIVSGVLVGGVVIVSRPGTARELSTTLRRGIEDQAAIVVPRIGRVTLADVCYVGDGPAAVFRGCAICRYATREEIDGRVTSDSFVDMGGDWSPDGAESASVTHSFALARTPFVVQSIAIESPRDWTVNDVAIDGRSQLAYPGDVPCEALLAPGALGMYLGVSYRDVQVSVSYVGGLARGPAFACSIVGRPVGN